MFFSTAAQYTFTKFVSFLQFPLYKVERKRYGSHPLAAENMVQDKNPVSGAKCLVLRWNPPHRRLRYLNLVLFPQQTQAMQDAKKRIC